MKPRCTDVLLCLLILGCFLAAKPAPKPEKQLPSAQPKAAKGLTVPFRAGSVWRPDRVNSIEVTDIHGQMVFQTEDDGEVALVMRCLMGAETLIHGSTIAVPTSRVSATHRIRIDGPTMADGPHRAFIYDAASGRFEIALSATGGAENGGYAIYRLKEEGRSTLLTLFGAGAGQAPAGASAKASVRDGAPKNATFETSQVVHGLAFSTERIATLYSDESIWYTWTAPEDLVAKVGAWDEREAGDRYPVPHARVEVYQGDNSGRLLNVGDSRGGETGIQFCALEGTAYHIRVVVEAGRTTTGGGYTPYVLRNVSTALVSRPMSAGFPVISPLLDPTSGQPRNLKFEGSQAIDSAIGTRLLLALDGSTGEKKPCWFTYSAGSDHWVELEGCFENLGSISAFHGEAEPFLKRVKTDTELRLRLLLHQGETIHLRILPGLYGLRATPHDGGSPESAQSPEG